MTGLGVEVGAQAARSRAIAVLRVRSRALAVALLPAAAAVILLVGGSTGHFTGDGWDAARRTVTPFAVLVLLAAAGIALIVARSRPAMSPTVTIAEKSAPDLYRLVRELADRLDVPAPSAIALTPDCDSWLEDRTHPAHGPSTNTPTQASAAPGRVPDADEPHNVPAGSAPGSRDDHDDPAAGIGVQRRTATATAPVLVIGSPFLWWMRVGELRAVLAPVVAGTGPSSHPDIAAARRFVRGLDAAVAVTSAPGRGPLTRPVLAGAGWVVRLLLRGCRVHAAEMERGVAIAAAERAQAVDYGLRIVAQEQVGLAYAGWDRLLTRVALPAWRMGRWPSRLDAGVVAALTELSRRDRLAEGFASRLGERPACDLLEEPGLIDEATSLLAARLFHGGPAESGPDWSPVDWDAYPEEVVDRKWRSDAARLHRVLDTLGIRRDADAHTPDRDDPTLARVLHHLAEPTRPSAQGPTPEPHRPAEPPEPAQPAESAESAGSAESAERPHRPDESDGEHHRRPDGEHDAAHADRCTAAHAVGYTVEHAVGHGHDDEFVARYDDEADEEEDLRDTTPRSADLAAGLSAEVAREEAIAARTAPPADVPRADRTGPDTALWDDQALPLFPLQPPRSGRELLADHITALVCCAAVDTAGAVPGLDWLDGPSLLVNGVRATDLGPRVLSLVERGDPTPLRSWLTDQGIRPDKPVRLV
ncbi:hypothetical protein ABZ354_16190 [Streptomyces sp. NPDC005925]|uniref:hypothetical protein n=1 Tax=Streptomyces sp. NPDC005925 TaxID=3157172 RepID=UPI0033F5463D